MKDENTNQRIKIFLVEDSKIIGGILKRCLEMNGIFDVTLFCNYDEVMAQMKIEKPRLIVTDYFLDPNVKTSKTGGDIAIDIKKIFPKAIVILLTGMEDTNKIPHYELDKFDRVLNKNEHEVMDYLELHIIELIGSYPV